MLKREDLESLKPTYWSLSYGKQLVAVPMAAGKVLHAAPALALACLDGLEALRRVYDSGDPMRTADLVRGMAAFQRALAAASVEVE